jgi:hypothetical protein
MGPFLNSEITRRRCGGQAKQDAARNFIHRRLYDNVGSHHVRITEASLERARLIDRGRARRIVHQIHGVSRARYAVNRGDSPVSPSRL